MGVNPLGTGERTHVPKVWHHSHCPPPPKSGDIAATSCRTCISHYSHFPTLDVLCVSDFLMNIPQTCTLFIHTIIYIGAVSRKWEKRKLGSNLLVLKLKNCCFKTHSARFKNPQNQQRPGMGGARIFAVWAAWGQSQGHRGQNRACP